MSDAKCERCREPVREGEPGVLRENSTMVIRSWNGPTTRRTTRHYIHTWCLEASDPRYRAKTA